MSRLSPDAWRALSPYLDQALEIAEEERDSWLESLREENPLIAAQVKTLLDEQRAIHSEGFLEQTPPVPSQAALAGQSIGAYTLVAPIGEGGMGSVWHAMRSDGRFERKVALKFLKITLTGRGLEERFKREGKILGRLTHPHIAQLLDAGVSQNGQPYLVIEHIDGEHIDLYCDRNKLGVEARIRLFLEVLAAVAHAHTNLIVHRDLKPSNVLVNTEGQVKLLDFGIAKLLKDEADPGAASMLTRESGGAMTLLYAAPEQMTGGNVTTATDVYALGAMLYLLLTGQHPAGPGPHSTADLIKSIVDTEPPRLSEVRSPENASLRSTTSEKVRRKLRGDVDTIVAKALKKNPQERYVSVSEFADDLRRHLNHEPIGARPDTLLYRADKFVRRHRTAVALASLAVVAIIAGIVGTTLQARTADRERALAQRRFNDVRDLANRLFLIDRQVLALPGNTKTRQLIVDTSLEYLSRLAADARTDPGLALDVGTAYMRVGRVQGVPIASNLGQPEKAEESLRIAEQLIASVLRADPGNHMAQLRAAQIAHDRMVLAENRHPDTAALPLARQSEAWLNKYLAGGTIDELEKQQVVIAGMNIANWYSRKDLTGESLRLLYRTIEIAKRVGLPAQAGAAQIVVARALRSLGDLDGALAATREGVQLLKPAMERGDGSSVTIFTLALMTQGEVLGSDRGISMDRHREAADSLDQAYRTMLRTARQDTHDAYTKLAIANRGRRLAGVLRQWDSPRALQIYDEVLAVMMAVANNRQARQQEAGILAASTYPLRQLGRSAEARKRLDAAFVKLRELKLYPVERIEPGSDALEALCAQAEMDAGTGKPQRGIDVYLEVVAKLTPTIQPETRLGDAKELSDIYEALAKLHRQMKQDDAASAVEAKQLALWRAWDTKLPNNEFVKRRLAAAHP